MKEQRESEEQLFNFINEFNSRDRLSLQTSGSTGKPKTIIVEKRRMEASARITCEFLHLKPGDTALLCLPLDFIAGKMMVVRALTAKLNLRAVAPSGNPLAKIDCAPTFAAMIPAQVYNSLRDPDQRRLLFEIKQLIIGGGAISDELAKELKTAPNPVWSTYGMTETLSHIALRRLSGESASEWYTPFPSVDLSLNDDHCLVIDAPEVCGEQIITNDIAELRSDGCFKIIGRRDNVVCSGGIKIQIEEVENLLRPLNRPFLVTAVDDDKYGEVTVLLVEGNPGQCKEALEQSKTLLPKFWIPKHVVSTNTLPLTPTGKPNRAEARLYVKKRLTHG